MIIDPGMVNVPVVVDFGDGLGANLVDVVSSIALDSTRVPIIAIPRGLDYHTSIDSLDNDTKEILFFLPNAGMETAIARGT